MDAGYGVDTDLRTSITALGLSYVAGIQSHTTVWALAQGRARQRSGAVMGDHRSCCAAMAAQTDLGQKACVGFAKACLAHTSRLTAR